MTRLLSRPFGLTDGNPEGTRCSGERPLTRRFYVTRARVRVRVRVRLRSNQLIAACYMSQSSRLQHVSVTRATTPSFPSDFGYPRSADGARLSVAAVNPCRIVHVRAEAVGNRLIGCAARAPPRDQVA